MSVTLDGDTIRLEGDCRIEQAEALALLLHQDAHRPVDLSACRSLHGALAQVLISYRASVLGAPADTFIRTLVLPALRQPSAAVES